MTNGNMVDSVKLQHALVHCFEHLTSKVYRLRPKTHMQTHTLSLRPNPCAQLNYSWLSDMKLELKHC